MPSTDSRPGDRHRHPAIGYRPPEEIRPLLEAHMEQTGRGASAVITQALREYFAKPERALTSHHRETPAG